MCGGTASSRTRGVFGNFACFRRFAICLAVGQACAPASDVVSHADWAYVTAAFEAGSGQGLRSTAAALRGTTDGVTFPTARLCEAARTASFGRIFGRAASSTARVFSNFASGRLSACCLAVRQACTPAFDVVTHADWANILAANKFGSGQVLRRAFRATTDDVTFPTARRCEAARTASFGRIFGGTASSTGRVFGNFAASRLFARCNAVGQGCAPPTFDVVTHADWAYFLATHKFSSGQVLHGASRPAANGVTFPGRRCREAARTASFGRIFGGTASFTGRVFGNFAAGRLPACINAVGQG